FQLQFEADPVQPVSQLLIAAQHARSASPREQQAVAAFRLALSGHTASALALIVEHLAAFPRDPLVLRELLVLRAFSGDEDRKAKTASELDALARQFGDDPWFLGIHALARGEVGDAGDAARLAERGLARRPDHGVLAHAFAHAMFEAGDHATGRDFLTTWI